MAVSKFSRTIPVAEAGIEYAIRLEADATEWLATLQLNTKTPNSAVARKMRLTPKHIVDILSGTPTLEDIAKMFYALGYKLHIYTEDIKTGKKHMQPPELLPHALKHPHIRAQMKEQKTKK